MFICGTGNFTHEDGEDDLVESCRSPKTKKTKTFCKTQAKDTSSNKNPYANRGLDKFYALLADLDSKKQMIYTQKGSEDISFVRFVYTNRSNRVKPIVVKVRDEKKKQEKSNSGLIKKSFKNSLSNINANEMIVTPEVPIIEKPGKERCLRCKESFKLDKMNRPYFYFWVIVVFVLVFIAMYGRSFAIFCTSVGWYVGPTVVGGRSSDERKPRLVCIARVQLLPKVS